MNKFQVLATSILFSSPFFGQINMNDSTVQVVAYWDNKEKQTYAISDEKYKVNGKDTTGRELITYEVDVTVKDSTAKSYTIEWYYKNYTCSSTNAFTKKLCAVSQNLSVLIKTDEMGAFVEVINWKEIRDYIKNSTNTLKTEFKDTPKIDEIVDQVLSLFTSKEAIQSAAIKDIQQFYTYHGGKYKLGEEVTAKMKLPNLFGGDPFDAEVTVKLDEINVEDGNSIIRMWQSVDSKQLTEATYKYLKDLAKTTGTKPPKRDEIPPLKNETRTASRIHGYSSWIIYSIETKEVSSETSTNVEERIIELK